MFNETRWKYFVNVEPSHEVLSKEFRRRTEMTSECGQVWKPRGVLRLQPKLEFYNRFMNVSKCFAEPVCWFTVKGFTCLQIKRGHTGPNSCLCVFFFSLVLGANILYSYHQRCNAEAFIIIDAFICEVVECNCVHLLEYLLVYFHFMQLHTSTSLHLGGKSCNFYST